VPGNKVLLHNLVECWVNNDLHHPNQDKHTKIYAQGMLMKKFQQNTHLSEIIVLGMGRFIRTFFKVIIKMTNSLPVDTFHLLVKFLLLVLLFGGCSSEPEQNSVSNIPNKVIQENVFRILILGDSLTEGYGVSEHQAYPTLLEEKLNQEIAQDHNTTFEVINAGISGSTTSGGVSRIDWLLQSSPDFLVVALGGNDGLRGVPVEETQKNLEKIIQTAKDQKIPTLLAGMKIPPNYGMEYTRKFAQLFQDLATKHQVALLPFLLEGVGGNPSMNLPDRIHPNPAGHQKISETVFKSLVSHLPKN